MISSLEEIDMATKEQQKIRIQRQAAYEKIRSCAENITYSDCMLAVDYDGQIISSIPQKLITEELCLAALKNNYLNKDLIRYIPKKLLTKKFAVTIVAISGVYLKYLPIEAVGKNVILKAVKQTIHAIKYIPEKYKTDEMYRSLFDIMPKVLKHIEKPSLSLCEYALDKLPSAIAYIKDVSILTDKLFEKSVISDWKNLKYIPSKQITRELCVKAFNSNYKAFKFFPDKYKTPELCKIVIGKDVSFLQYCPSSIISSEMCENCLKKRGLLLEFVPDILKTESICLLAIEQDYEAMQFVPQNILTNEFFIKCLKINLATLKFIPDELKTAEIYKTHLNYISFSKHFREWLISEERYYSSRGRDYEKYIALKSFSRALATTDIDNEILKLERKLHLRKTINSSYDNETNLFTIREMLFKELVKKEVSSFEDFYMYLEGNLQGSNLTEYQFEGIDISSYNLDGAYLCSKILIQQGNYNGDFYDSSIGQFSEEVSLLPVLSHETIEAGLISHAEVYSEKLNSCDRKIFYITDIHLNHRLIDRFPKYATFDEIKFFIQKYVRKIIKTACNKGVDDYILIGGDVSFCFDISKIFYTELCKYWTPSKIVVILGNHELWDFNRYGVKASNCSLEDIIEKYKLLFSELGISFLQNSLLIVKQYSSSIISEKDILDRNTNELRAMALDSNLIIFGGIGFSAYNLEFNATKGIYRNAITSLQNDLQYTQQSELVYNKLYEAFFEDKIIILSHMPPKDWSKRDLVPNWIYVNGHTHSNYYIQSAECTVYADNQMGYTSKSIGLKYFKMSFYYDTFKYYSDGIYHITKAQYMEFNNGNGTRCTFNKDVDSIVMLKRQGIYLFLLEDKEKNKLFLLNGGVTNRLKVTDLNYYYENMLKYSDYIKLGMKKYNEALKSISDVVKKIGGDGTIHGCIVDIDFYNHIYLNPQDGSISAYYSPWFGDRYEYPTVEQLLDKQLPQLYANYKNLIGTTSSLVVMSNIDISSSEAMHILDTTQYKPSRLIKRLQYTTESNVIRIWSDDFISNQEQYIGENKKLLT